MQRIVLAPVSVDGLLLPGDQRLQPGRAVPDAGDPAARHRPRRAHGEHPDARTSRSIQIVNRRGIDGHGANGAERATATAPAWARERLQALRDDGRRHLADGHPRRADGGQYVATGLEHNETAGRATTPATTAEMTEKRFRKLELAAQGGPAGPLLRRPGRRTSASSPGARPGAPSSRRSTRCRARASRSHAMAPQHALAAAGPSARCRSSSRQAGGAGRRR